MKQLEILRRNLGDTKETRVGLTTEENEENAINDIIDLMESDGYEQGDATPAEMEQWDNEFRDWVVMNDVEFEEDRVLIFVRK